MKHFVLSPVAVTVAALLTGIGFCNKHFKKFILLAGTFLGLTGIAHAQTYTPKSPNGIT
jgi:hypothetical protein